MQFIDIDVDVRGLLLAYVHISIENIQVSDDWDDNNN